MIYAWKPFKLSSSQQILADHTETRYRRRDLSKLKEMTLESGGKPQRKQTLGNDTRETTLEQIPRLIFCLSVCLRPSRCHCFCIFATIAAAPERTQIFSVHQWGGVVRPLSPDGIFCDGCLGSRCHRGATADGTMQCSVADTRITEQVNGKIVSGIICRVSPRSQTPRRQTRLSPSVGWRP